MSLTPNSIYYLIVKASGEARLVKSTMALGKDEFAYRVIIKHTGGWGKVIGEITIDTPPPPESIDVENSLRQLKDHLDHP